VDVPAVPVDGEAVERTAAGFLRGLSEALGERDLPESTARRWTPPASCAA
jgi:hypothetical protein